MSIVVTFARFLPFDHWLVDLTSHGVFHLVMTGSVCGVLLLLSRQILNALAMFAVVGLNIYALLPLYMNSHEPTPGNSYQRLKVFQANVLGVNQQHGALIDEILNQDPDIIALQEVNQHWSSALKDLKSQYPYGMTVTREDNFGIALLSRYPMDVTSVSFGYAKTPSLQAVLPLAAKTIQLIVTHPVPPIGRYAYALRNDQTQQLAKALNAVNDLNVVLGDLNNTLWSRHYLSLEQYTGLYNIRQGHGVLATWPAAVGFLGIPIDHILVSRAIKVSDVKVGGAFGSDHLPLMATLHIPH